MSAYFKSPARPVLSVASSDELRSETSALLTAGQLAIFTAADTGVVVNTLAKYDPDSTESDDGETVWEPADLTIGETGRWLIVGGENVNSGYVLRKSDGTIEGAGAGSPDFAEAVLHVNEGGATPVAGLYGLSVFYTAGAARKGLFWDPVNATWAAAADTLGDDSIISTYLPLRTLSLATTYVANAAGGTAASGLLRMASGDEIRARIGSEYRMLAALAGPTVAFGDTTVDTVTLDSAVLLRATSQLAAELRASTTISIKDPTGGTTLAIASVAGSYLDVFGRLRAKNGGTTVLDVDVGSGEIALNGKVNAKDALGADTYFSVSSGISTIFGTATVKNAAGSTTVLTVAGASSLATMNGQLEVYDSTGATLFADIDPATHFKITKSGIGTTKTFALVFGNDTNSGTQVSPQIAGYAFHATGPTRHNFAIQVEPQSATRQITRFLYGTGTSPPTSTWVYLDNSDSSYGVIVAANAFLSTGGTGYRLSVNGGGVKETGGGRALFQSAVAGEPWEALSSTSTGNTGARFQLTADAGTPSAGYLLRVGYGSGSFSTSKFDLYYDGRIGLANVDPTAAGVLGMSTSTGRLRLYVGGAADSVAVLADIGGVAMQSGVATLTSGVTTLIAANVTANTRVVGFLKTPSGTTLTTEYAALDSDRVVGASGSGGGFKLTALVAAGTINTADGSTLDWVALG